MDIEQTSLDRRRALQCLGWAGTGALFTLGGGVAASMTLDRALAAAPKPSRTAAFSFLQISDTHIGFSKPANPDPIGTLKETIAKVKALPRQPDLIVHTGDLTHLATPAQFDQARQLIDGFGVPVFFIPGEHDVVDGNDPRPFITRFAPKGAGTGGWYSFDAGGVHFVALVNVVQLGDRGMGTLGADQLEWLKKDLAPHSASTPVVVLSHFPLWALYPDWGWGTEDALAALTLLARFGSVTALNGHVHQIQRKVEGHVSFHAARSTAYPQAAPGEGPGPGPLLVPSEKLRSAIGFSDLTLTHGDGAIAVTDQTVA
jgi:Icc protein